MKFKDYIEDLKWLIKNAPEVARHHIGEGRAIVKNLKKETSK